MPLHTDYMKATSQSFQGALGRMLIVSMGQRLNYLEIPVCAGRDDFVAIAIKLGSETNFTVCSCAHGHRFECHSGRCPCISTWEEMVSALSGIRLHGASLASLSKLCSADSLLNGHLLARIQEPL